MSVRALQGGAVDFLEKPYEPQKMLEVVQAQLVNAAERFEADRQRRGVLERLAALTPREREVLRLVIDGMASKQIARELSTSIKTVDVHRARIKAKTEAESVGSLVRDILSFRIVV